MAADDGGEDDEEEEMGTRRRSSTQLTPAVVAVLVLVFPEEEEEEDGLILFLFGNDSFLPKRITIVKLISVQCFFLLVLAMLMLAVPLARASTAFLHWTCGCRWHADMK